jgi:hypothetical protein
MGKGLLREKGQVQQYVCHISIWVLKTLENMRFAESELACLCVRPFWRTGGDGCSGGTWRQSQRWDTCFVFRRLYLEAKRGYLFKENSYHANAHRWKYLVLNNDMFSILKIYYVMQAGWKLFHLRQDIHSPVQNLKCAAGWILPHTDTWVTTPRTGRTYPACLRARGSASL